MRTRASVWLSESWWAVIELNSCDCVLVHDMHITSNFGEILTKKKPTKKLMLWLVKSWMKLRGISTCVTEKGRNNMWDESFMAYKVSVTSHPFPRGAGKHQLRMCEMFETHSLSSALFTERAWLLSHVQLSLFLKNACPFTSLAPPFPSLLSLGARGRGGRRGEGRGGEGREGNRMNNGFKVVLTIFILPFATYAVW